MESREVCQCLSHVSSQASGFIYSRIVHKTNFVVSPCRSLPFLGGYNKLIVTEPCLLISSHRSNNILFRQYYPLFFMNCRATVSGVSPRRCIELTETPEVRAPQQEEFEESRRCSIECNSHFLLNREQHPILLYSLTKILPSQCAPSLPFCNKMTSRPTLPRDHLWNRGKSSAVNGQGAFKMQIPRQLITHHSLGHILSQ